MFRPPRHVLRSGFVVDPAVPFIPAEIGNYSSTIQESTTTEETWQEGGITYTAIIVRNATVSITATLGAGNVWTYSEVLVSSYTVSTSGSDGSTAYESGVYEYTFLAAGTVDEYGTVVTSGYSFTATGLSSASGSVTKTWSSGGWSDTTSYQWTWSAGFEEAVTTSADLAAGSGSGSASGVGWSDFAYSASGSYTYGFLGGSASGTHSASGAESLSYGYSIAAWCAEGQWTKTGSANLSLEGTAYYQQIGSGSFAASGSGEPSSSGSGSASGSGLPLNLQWGYSGTFSEAIAHTSSY